MYMAMMADDGRWLLFGGVQIDADTWKSSLFSFGAGGLLFLSTSLIWPDRRRTADMDTLSLSPTVDIVYRLITRVRSLLAGRRVLLR